MQPVVLVILDGWGYSKISIGNAIKKAQKPNIDFLLDNFPSVLLQASGKAVGMTWGEPGNSEVGHLTIGLGRVIFQALSRINKSIDDGSFFNNPSFLGAVNNVKRNNTKLHLVGLLSSGSIHSYFNHIVSLLEMASKNSISQVYLHLFLDGKDSSPKSGYASLYELSGYLSRMNIGKIGTIIGREYGMDRNKNWDRTEKAYQLMVDGLGEKTDDPLSKIQDLYDMGFVDANIPPIVADQQGLIGTKDSVVFFNFREDSMRQLSRAFIDPEFSLFPTPHLADVYYAAMTQYFHISTLHAAFPTEELKNSLSEMLTYHGKTHLHIAETEKYAHTTFFFNGLSDMSYPGETDILIDSVKNPSEYPRMRADEICKRAVEEIQREFYDFIVINFANADTLAHFGNMETTVRGIETIDENIGLLYKAVTDKKGIMIVTSDHGHAESMVYKGTGEVKTGHALNPVPFTLVGSEFKKRRNPKETEQYFSTSRGIISDIAPTILELMKIEKPHEMTGKSLLGILTTQ